MGVHQDRTHPVPESPAVLSLLGGVLGEGESFADVGEDIALKEEGVILRLELDVVALHGFLLHCRAYRELGQGKEYW